MTGNMKNKIGNECCGAQTLTSSNVYQLPGVLPHKLVQIQNSSKRNQVQQVDGIKAIKSKSIAAFFAAAYGGAAGHIQRRRGGKDAVSRISGNKQPMNHNFTEGIVSPATCQQIDIKC